MIWALSRFFSENMIVLAKSFFKQLKEVEEMKEMACSSSLTADKPSPAHGASAHLHARWLDFKHVASSSVYQVQTKSCSEGLTQSKSKGTSGVNKHMKWTRRDGFQSDQWCISHSSGFRKGRFISNINVTEDMEHWRFALMFKRILMLMHLKELQVD